MKTFNTLNTSFKVLSSKTIIFSLIIIILSMSAFGCSGSDSEVPASDYSKTPSAAYDRGRTLDMFGDNPKIEQEIATIKASDDISFWIAVNDKDCAIVAPMYTKGDTYYFTGHETVYHIPDISDECYESDRWDIYDMNGGIHITLFLFKGETYTGKDASDFQKVTIDKENYVLVWTYSMDK